MDKNIDFTILGPVIFAKTTIHFQNSSKSMTIYFPVVLFKALPVAKVALCVGIILFLVQFSTTTIYGHFLDKALSDRVDLNRELFQAEDTLNYLYGVTSEFFKDEQRLHSKFGLPMLDVEERELGTGGFIPADTLLLRETSPIIEKISTLRESVNCLQGKLDNSNVSFRAIADYVKQKKSAWRYIPSIAPTQGRLGSTFGPRIHPVTGEEGKMHNGVDLSNDRWTPIFATADGVVETAQLSTSFGNYITLDHGNGLKTRYGHMQMYVVHRGQMVHRYQLLGYIGNTGLSTGPHLHYEVWLNNTPVNPLAYMLPDDKTVD